MARHIEVEGLDYLLPKIKTLPETAKKQVIEDVSKFSIDTIKDKSYPPQKSVSRKQAYGVTFFSPAQRAWFWANYPNPETDLPYKRTDTFKNSWQSEYIQDGVTFYNTMEGAQFVMGFAFQSRHEKMVGWLTVLDMISKYLTFANSRFRNTCMDAYQKAIRKLDLG